jgi:uncharacterized membrane protein
LFLAGVLFDFLGVKAKNPMLDSAAYFNFLFAALSTIPVMGTGLLAWRWALEGQPLKGVLLLHLIFGTASSILIWTIWLLHRRGRQGHIAGSAVGRLCLECLAALCVVITGHLGGFLSGVNIPN